MEDGGHLGLRHRQRREGYRWEWGIHVIAECLLAVLSIFIQATARLSGVYVWRVPRRITRCLSEWMNEALKSSNSRRGHCWAREGERTT